PTTGLFALWPLLEVRHVRPKLILRREVADEPAGSPGRMAWAISGLLAFALAGMALWQAGSWRAAGLFIGALAAALALLNATAWLVVRLAKGLSRWGLPAGLPLRRGEGGGRGDRSPFRGDTRAPPQVVSRTGPG